MTHERPEGLSGRCGNYPGGDLLSHAVASAVPSALEGLTSVFGMGTGVAPPVSLPGSGSNTEILECSHAMFTLHWDEFIVVKPHGRLVPVS